MADKMTKEQRHYCMSRIRGKNTKPEIIVRKFLFANGFRFRKNVRSLPGTPDIVLKKFRTVIFINGCFWHGHEGCKYYVIPKSNTEYWKNKIETNQKRDLRDRLKLRDMGWHVIQIWECQLKPKVRAATLNDLVYVLNRIFLENLSPTIQEDTIDGSTTIQEDTIDGSTTIQKDTVDGNITIQKDTVDGSTTIQEIRNN